MYGLTDDDGYLVDFHFLPSSVQAMFMADSEYISIVIAGQIYELEYSVSLYDEIMSYLKMRTLGLN